MVIWYRSLTLGSIEALSDLIDKTQSQSEANIDSVYTVACQVYTRCAIPIAETKVDLPVDYVVSKIGDTRVQWLCSDVMNIQKFS